MRKLLGIVGLVLIGLVAYLLAWPVAIDPVAWEAPEDPGYVGVYAENLRLAGLERLEMGAEGPEDIEIRDGLIYASAQSGLILSYDLATDAVREVADTGGVPLGLEFDRNGDLLVADAHKGLLRVGLDGTVETLLGTFEGAPILYADDVDQGPDGTICFSDASTRHGAEAIGSTMEASLYEIVEHASTGRILCTDANGDNPYILKAGLSFPNGVAFTPNGDLLVNITGTYETLRIESDGTTTRFAGPYPGFPDNINPGPDRDGEPTYLVGLVSPRSSDLDAVADKPWARRAMWRLPASMRPAATDYTHIVMLDADGDVIASLQDPTGGYAQATGARVHAGSLYLSSLTETAVGRIDLPNSLKE